MIILQVFLVDTYGKCFVRGLGLVSRMGGVVSGFGMMHLSWKGFDLARLDNCHFFGW
jgi:hypothetical protein